MGLIIFSMKVFRLIQILPRFFQPQFCELIDRDKDRKEGQDVY